MGIFKRSGAIIIIMLHFYAASGQQSRDVFGQSRIQYKNFEWRFYSSENFDVYFYDNGQKSARFAVDYLEEEFERVTDLLGYVPYNKTRIFLYNSVVDLQQSNVGLSKTFFSVGGQTNFVKPQVEIAHPGTNFKFKEELLYRMANIYIIFKKRVYLHTLLMILKKFIPLEMLLCGIGWYN